MWLLLVLSVYLTDQMIVVLKKWKNVFVQCKDKNIFSEPTPAVSILLMIGRDCSCVCIGNICSLLPELQQCCAKREIADQWLDNLINWYISLRRQCHTVSQYTICSHCSECRTSQRLWLKLAWICALVFKSNQIRFILGNIWPIKTSRKTVNIKKTEKQI